MEKEKTKAPTKAAKTENTKKAGTFSYTKNALRVRKEVQSRRKSRRMHLREQIAKEKQTQDILRGINNICGSLFQTSDVGELVFYIEDDSLNAVLQLLAMDSLLYKYVVEGNMLHIYAQMAQ